MFKKNIVSVILVTVKLHIPDFYKTEPRARVSQKSFSRSAEKWTTKKSVGGVDGKKKKFESGTSSSSSFLLLLN